MTLITRPRRSVLYMPGSNPRALKKGRSLAADALIFDLEDAVAPDAKETARKLVTQAVRKGGYARREIIIRVNALSTPWGAADLIAAARSGADVVLLPKVDSATMVHAAEAALVKAGAPEELALWCMMETPRGILHAEEIACASARVGGLVLGTSDLTHDLQAIHTAKREPMFTSLGLVLLAGRAAGIAIIDGVHLDLEDAEGFAASCNQGLEFGFDGKTLIHPKQIAVANDVFAPSAEQVVFAQRIIEAHAAAAAEGKGIVLVDGKLIENLHVVTAQRLVTLSETIAEMGFSRTEALRR